MADLQDKISLSRVWPVLLGVFLFGVVAIQLLRVNQPPPTGAEVNRNQTFKATTG